MENADKDLPQGKVALPLGKRSRKKKKALVKVANGLIVFNLNHADRIDRYIAGRKKTHPKTAQTVSRRTEGGERDNGEPGNAGRMSGVSRVAMENRRDRFAGNGIESMANCTSTN